MEPEADSKEQNGTRDSQWSQKLPAGNSRGNQKLPKLQGGAETASHRAPDGAGELPTGRQRESETAKIPMEAETASHGAPDGARELPAGRQRESETAKIPMEAGPANQGLELEPENCQQGRDPQGK